MAERKIKNMEEFAEVSGISRPTVSKYFHNPDSVRKSTRTKIEAALEQHDYRPNVYAINQNRQLTKNIGIVVPYLADPFFGEIARRIERRCIAAGYSPNLFSSHGEQALENQILDGLRSLKPAGVLLAPLGRASDKRMIEKFCRDVPTILFDSNLDDIGEAFVGSDNPSFVSQSIDYLVRSGEPPVFFEMEAPVNPNARKRRAAYISKMDDLGLEPHIIKLPGDGWAFEEIGFQGAAEVLAAGKLPTNTILCSNDRLAIGVLSACYEGGFKVGQGPECDFRVAGHDDHPFARYTSPSLTTVAHDYDSVSNRSVEMLFDLIDSGGRFAKRSEILFAARLILRASA